MIIPKTFKLGGLTIKVSYQKGLFHEDDVHGFAKYRTNEIVLQPSTEDAPIPREAIEQAFIHEVTHFLLYHAGEDQFDPPLHKREFLVDRIALLMHQAITTGEGELE